MRQFSKMIAAALLGCTLAPFHVAAQSACPDAAKGLGVSRIIEIDASAGPIFGHITKQESEQSFLAPKEVVLTFDDGPMHRLTPQILDSLDAFCTKATFFVVGQMALSNPQGLRDTLARGHTVGTHTWSHPLNIARMPLERAKAQIEQGFAAATLAAGTGVAPFFRFPGLSDSRELMAYLQDRGIAAFTVDVVSNDSYIPDPAQLTRLTLDRLRAQGRGIILFHDIKAATARALPGILAALKADGYKIVHLRTKAPYTVPEGYAAAMRAHATKLDARAGSRPRLLAITDPAVAGSERGPDGSDAPMPVPVTALAPAPKTRVPLATAHRGGTTAEILSPDDLKAPVRRRSATSASHTTPAPSTWRTSTHRVRSAGPPPSAPTFPGSTFWRWPGE